MLLVLGVTLAAVEAVAVAVARMVILQLPQGKRLLLTLLAAFQPSFTGV
jgi:hypothetical protein